MKKLVLDIVVVIYMLVAIFITATLLAFNEYQVTEFGNTSLVTLNTKIGSYNESDLLLISKTNIASIKSGDNIVYYKETDSNTKIEISKVKKINKTSEVNFFTDNGDFVLEENVLGTDENIKVIPLVGSILEVFQSKWGYLGIIILPISLGFIYELYAVVRELKKDRKK